MMVLLPPIALLLMTSMGGTSAFTTTTSATIHSGILPAQTPPSSVCTTTKQRAFGTDRNRSSSKLFNVPPVSFSDDPTKIKDASDRESPPQSFYELQMNSAKAARLAIEDGYQLLEVEFPPLPANVLELDEVSAYDVARANLKLAVDFAKSFATQDDKTVAVLVPDEAEKKFAMETLGGTNKPHPGVLVSSLRQTDTDDDDDEQGGGGGGFKSILSFFGGNGGTVKPVEGADMYVIIVASAQELPDIEELHRLDPEKTIVFYNLKLDVLRGDLGAPAFPGKDLQDRFLSRVKPVYYLRTRQYSRSTPNPPFMINYQGCLFRSYPGQFQTLLDTGTGRYRRVEGNDVRPALGEFKEQLTKALQVDGIIKDEGKTMNFLRTGYKTTTWWEEERENASDLWKT